MLTLPWDSVIKLHFSYTPQRALATLRLGKVSQNVFNVIKDVPNLLKDKSHESASVAHHCCTGEHTRHSKDIKAILHSTGHGTNVGAGNCLFWQLCARIPSITTVMLGCKVLSSWESLLGVSAVKGFSQCYQLSVSESWSLCGMETEAAPITKWQGQTISSSTLTPRSFTKPAHLVKINQEREWQWSCFGGDKNTKSLNPSWNDPVVFVQREPETLELNVG